MSIVKNDDSQGAGLTTLIVGAVQMFDLNGGVKNGEIAAYKFLGFPEHIIIIHMLIDLNVHRHQMLVAGQ